jgi:acyl dehydratase
MTGVVLGNDLSRLRGISCRFAQPVYPGDRLMLTAYETQNRLEIPFTVFNESGQVVLKNGLFSYE